MRKTICFSTLIGLLIVGMAVAISACGGSTTASSSTTLSTVSESTTTAAGATTTTVGTAGSTTTAAGATTSTSAAETTTTQATPTVDTTDHTAELRADYPSTYSFDNSNWATLNAAPGSYLGAAVDVEGQPAKAAVDPDSKYLTWQLTISGTGGEQMTALCRTNITIDRSLLSGDGPVEVKGTVVGAQAASAGGGPIIYVQSVQKAA